MSVYDCPLPSPGLASALIQWGFQVPVSIAIPGAAAALIAEGVEIPAERSGHALIDTGATLTAVEAQALGIPAFGSVWIGTPSSSAQEERSLYAVRLEFPGTPVPTIDPAIVVAIPLAGFNIAALIGRDILGHCLMIWNGIAGHVTLAS